MPHLTTDDGIQLYYEETGKGAPIVFVHEFAGDLRSWEPQLRYFSRSYRCIAYNARGYPPSDVPAARSAYSQAIATDDIAAVMRHLGVARAHVIGLQALMEGRVESQAMNLGAGRGYSVREVIDSARRITGKDFTVRETGRRPGDPPKLIAAVDRAKKLLGWSAAESDLDNIVRSAWNWTRRL